MLRQELSGLRAVPIRVIFAIVLAGVLSGGASKAMSADQLRSDWTGLHIAGAKRGYVDSPMGQVHYWRAAPARSNAIPIVLIHQTPWFGVLFAKAMPLLAELGYDVIALDTPGFGLSDVPKTPPDVEDYADNMMPVLSGLGVERAAIVGHHTGASIAASFAQRHPELTACAVLHGPPLYTAEERQQRLSGVEGHAMPLAEDGSHFTDRWARVRGLFSPDASLESVQWSVMGWYLAGPEEWYGHRAAFSFDMETALKNVSAPTLIVSNTGDSIHEAAARVLKVRPDFEYTEFESGKTTHVIFDDPGPWVTVIDTFIRRRCKTG
jgi:pimeloyl-ACP methyl ester carboxylesterase